MIKIITVILIFITLLITGCQESFIPDVTGNDKILVVDGLITDNPDTNFVILSWALPYNNSNVTPVPVTNAIVTLTDNLGNNYILNGNSAGLYKTYPDQFTGVPGRTYILNIKTSDGNTYQSSPQIMEQTLPIDSIYGVLVNNQILVDNSISTQPQINTYVNINRPMGNSTNFRFESLLLLEYQYIEQPRGGPPINYYGWYSSNLNNQSVNITSSNYATSTSNIIDHEVNYFTYGFTNSNNLILDKIIDVLTIKEYAINNDTYNFYEQVNAQLIAGNELFSTIISQVNGNIVCTSKTGITVLGLFQASACKTYTYVLNTVTSSNIYSFININNLGIIPLQGVTKAIPPSWWVN